MTDHGHPVDPDRVEAARTAGVSAADAHAMGALLTLLADPLRTRILGALLVTEETCVGDLAVALSVSEDSVTYALRLLRTAGLVVRRREGGWVSTGSETARPRNSCGRRRTRSAT